MVRIYFLLLSGTDCSRPPPIPRTELSSDITIRTHLSALYDTLLEQNLLRIVEPYSLVEIEYVAQQVGQGRQAVELKCVSSRRRGGAHVLTRCAAGCRR